MKVYVVIERNCPEPDCDDIVFGVFSTREKAEEIKDDLCLKCTGNGERWSAEVQEFSLDELTDDYYFFTSDE